MTTPFHIATALAFALLAIPESARAQPPVVDPLTLDAAFERALTQNPSIVAARLRRAIDLANLAVARQRRNPEARVELERETPRQAFGIAMPIEAGAKRARRMAVADAAIRLGEAEVARTIIEVRASVRRAYFERLVAEERLVLLDEVRAIATRARDAAQQRFDVGSAPRLEVLQAQLAVDAADNETTAAHGAASASRATLNALLGFPLDAAPLQTTTVAALVPPLLDAALARALTSNADLVVLQRKIDEATARMNLARALRVPDVVTEASITHGAEPEFNTGWRAAVGVELPLFTRYSAGVLVEQSTVTQLKAQREAIATRVRGEITALATMAAAQREQYVRYHDQIVPRAVEVEQMAEDSYKLGQTGIAALLQALQATRDVRLRALQSALDFETALSDLEGTVGSPLP
jgi:outer membrane protein, heavy metal efflux system